MKKSYLPILLSLLVANWISGAAQAESRAILTKEKRIDLAPFTSVRLDLGADLIVTQGEARRAVIVAEARILELVNFSVEDHNQLTISAKKSFSTPLPVYIKLETPRLEAVQLNASGDIVVHNVNEQALRLAIDGAGNIEADGQVAALTASINGAGDLHLGRLASTDGDIAINGSGDAMVNVSNTLSVTIGGAGDVVYLAPPKRIDQTVGGAGEVRAATVGEQ